METGRIKQTINMPIIMVCYNSSSTNSNVVVMLIVVPVVIIILHQYKP